MKLPRVKDIKIGPEAEKEIAKCPHKNEWSSDPNSECVTCKYRPICMSRFWGVGSEAVFDYDKDLLKKQSFIKQMIGKNLDEIF